MLSLVCFNDILDYIILVLYVHSQHLNSLALVANNLADLGINYLFQILNPDVPRVVILLNYARHNELGSNKEVLVNVVHQILQISVHARLRINRLLLTRDQVVELNDADRHGLILLSLDHELPQLDVPD